MLRICFVSQPTFSYQIKLLEEEVGFEIIVRNGKGATLTPAGQQFVTYLSNMRKEMKRVIEQGQNFSAKYKENITISMSVGRLSISFQKQLRNLKRNPKELRLHYVSSTVTVWIAFKKMNLMLYLRWKNRQNSGSIIKVGGK